jgi:hypothetical protein
MQQPDSETSSPGVASAPTSTLTPDSGPGVAWGKAFVARLREQGVSGAGILRPLIDDLNARAALSPFDKATAARVACNAQGTPDWGAGPVVAMPNGDLIVTPRMVAKEGPVLIVKPDGGVLRGTAGIDMLNETTYVVSNVIEGRWPAKAIWVGEVGRDEALPRGIEPLFRHSRKN